MKNVEKDIIVDVNCEPMYVIDIKLQDIEGNWGWYRYNPDYSFYHDLYYESEITDQFLSLLSDRYNAEVRLVKLTV